MNKTLIFISLILLIVVKADIKSDIVTDLNDQTGYTKTWYSGYLDISTPTNQQKTHYFFFPSQGNPETDPVVMWMNGGPGCSSLLGATQENGPFQFKVNSTEIELNPYSWNMKANVLYLESPPGVGFSTTQNPEFNDDTTAQANLDSLVQFFKFFPEYSQLPFYLSGESYAGIYIPYLASSIVSYNLSVDTKQEKIKLEGFMIGNGCTDPLECSQAQLADPWMFDALATQYFFSPEQLDFFHEQCGSVVEPDADKFKSIGCFLAAFIPTQLVTANVNVYNLIGMCYNQKLVYPTTGEQSFTSAHQRTWLPELEEYYHRLMNDKLQQEELEEIGVNVQQVLEQRRILQDQADVPPCTDAIGPFTFFNTQSVKKALHVDLDINWEMCSGPPQLKYTRSTIGSYHLYPNLLKQGLRIWIYSGDSDSVVASSGTLYWFQKLVNQQKYGTVVDWRSWYTPGVIFGDQPNNRQNAGQFWRTEGITLVMFKGCGHMVPSDNPVGAQQMVEYFVQGKDLPAF